MLADDLDSSKPPDPSALERRLRSLGEFPIPEGLLDRCLATVSGQVPDQSPLLRRWPPWWGKVAAIAAAAVLVAAVGIVARPRHADAALLLDAVRSAWTKVAASHRRQEMRGPRGIRVEEIWFVRGRGYRQEIRKDDQLIGIVVANPRWEFHWDVPGRLVAAWSPALSGKRVPPDLDGLVCESEAMRRWAEEHRAEIQVSADTVQGRPARKMVMHWPGLGGDGSLAQTTTVWFDPESLRPIREFSDLGGGRTVEAAIDYPEPSAVADDLLTFRPPRDVLLEINDPDLGRQVYSEGRMPLGETSNLIPKGTEP